jgi:hypothetical protein
LAITCAFMTGHGSRTIDGVVDGSCKITRVRNRIWVRQTDELTTCDDGNV